MRNRISAAIKWTLHEVTIIEPLKVFQISKLIFYCNEAKPVVGNISEKGT